MINPPDNTKPDIEGLLNLYTCATDVDNKTISFYQYVDFAYREEFSYTYDEVRELHPLFPEALQGLCDWHNRTMGHGHPATSNVTATLKLLRGDVVKTRNEHGTEYLYSRVKDIDELNDLPEQVFISGDELLLSKRNIEGSNVSFVIACVQQMHGVSKAALDEQYPGWMERWVIGEELGLTGLELTRQAFPATLLPEASVLGSDFTFD